MKARVRRELRQFGKRFIICLVIVGAGYLLGFVAIPKLLHHDPPSKQLASLRSALNQVYIDGNNIAGFAQQDATAYATLNDLIGQFKTDGARLQQAVKAAQHDLSEQQRTQINTIQQSQQQTADNLQAQYQLLAAPLRYDPADDFAGLDKGQLVQHATAARQGLQHILKSIQLADGTANSIDSMSSCLHRITVSTDTNQAKRIAASCAKEYPSLRRKLIQNIIGQGLSTSYQSYVRVHMPALLADLAKQ